MNQISNRSLKKTSEKPIQCIKGPHFGIGETEILTNGRQKRRKDPTEPVINAMGDHEDYQDRPRFSVA
jgi:hypothetical protein